MKASGLPKINIINIARSPRHSLVVFRFLRLIVHEDVFQQFFVLFDELLLVCFSLLLRDEPGHSLFHVFHTLGEQRKFLL